MNLLDNTSHQPSKFRTKNWVKLNDESRGTYSTNSQINFYNFNVTSTLCDYSDVYILVKGTIIITGRGADQATRQTDKSNQGAIFKIVHNLKIA